MKNPYEALGIKKNASDDEISGAYRESALKYHPDRNPDDKEAVEKFKEVAAAFEILGDKKKRAEFDRFGTVRSGPGPGFRPFRHPMHDFMSSFFGDRGRPSRGSHIVVEEEYTLEEILEDTEREIKYQRYDLCSACNGVGGEETNCSECKGTGARIIHGQAMIVRVQCEVCGGSGKAIYSYCKECKDGLVGPNEQTVMFKAPKGVETGMRFSFNGKGEPTAGGDSGNLYVIVKIKPHEKFERLQNGNILLKVPIHYTQLVLGGDLEVPTLKGEAICKVPPGSIPNNKFRMKGLGLPVFNPRRGIHITVGDQLVEVELNIPKNLDGRYQELIAELAEMEKKGD